MGHILRTNLTNILTMPNTTWMESKHNMVHVFFQCSRCFCNCSLAGIHWFGISSHFCPVFCLICLCVFACLFSNYWFPCFPNVLLGFLVFFCFGKSWLFDKKRHLFSMSSFVSYSFPCVSDCSCTCMGFFPEKRTARYTKLSIPATVLVCFNAICMLCAFF